MPGFVVFLGCNAKQSHLSNLKKNMLCNKYIFSLRSINHLSSKYLCTVHGRKKVCNSAITNASMTIV